MHIHIEGSARDIVFALIMIVSIAFVVFSTIASSRSKQRRRQNQELD
jgi:hypothetical protein